jgi:hypothetical protein
VISQALSGLTPHQLLEVGPALGWLLITSGLKMTGFIQVISIGAHQKRLEVA